MISERLQEKWQAFLRLKMKMGLLAAVRYALKRLLARRTSKHLDPTPQTDVIGFYSYVNPIPFGDYPEFVDQHDTINWVIPDFGAGSGGHLNIFRLILGIEKQGFKCRVIIDGPSHFENPIAARESIRTLFFPIEADVYIGRESMSPAWATVATSWQTAYAVRDYQATRMKFYFVQDFEPFFYAHGSEKVFAEDTYRFGFHGITAGQWLADILRSNYGMKTYAYGFSFDKDLYEPKPRRNSDTRRLFFYARPVTQRRGFELGMLVLAEVIHHMPDVAVIFAGWDVSKYKISFPHLNAGIVPLEELADLYSQCDLGLVLSFTNISLLPLELMASGCPVVSNNGPNVQWLLNDSNSLIANPSVKDLSDAIIGLMKDQQRLKEQREAGLAFARSTSWDCEISKLVNHIRGLQNASPA
jgi:glycosyltransferase involved in cell wall biosynthesis